MSYFPSHKTLLFKLFFKDLISNSQISSLKDVKTRIDLWDIFQEKDALIRREIRYVLSICAG
jgi:predicted CoA-binding protein